MAQAKQPKGGGKDDGESRKVLTPEEMAQLAEESPLTGLTSALAEQDRRDAKSGAEAEEDGLREEDDLDPEDGAPASAMPVPNRIPEPKWEPQLAVTTPNAKNVATADVHGGGLASDNLQGADAASRRKQTVLKINAKAEETLYRAAKLADEGALEIGDIVIDDECNGSIELVLSKNPRKRQSLNKISEALAQDSDLMVDARKLGRWTRAAALRRRLKAKGVDVSGFSLSDFEALLLEHDSEEQLKLALRIIREGLSARRTKEIIQDAKRKDYPEDIGKRLHTSIARLIEMVQDPDLVKTGSDKDLLHKDLSRRDRKILRDQIRSGKPEFAKLMKFLSDLEENLTNIDDEDRSQLDEDSTSQDQDEEE